VYSLWHRGIHYRSEVNAYKENPAIANPTTAPRKPTDTPTRVPLLLDPAAVVAVLEDAAPVVDAAPVIDAAPVALPEAEDPDEPLLTPATEIG